ncbi:ABC transporter ATP-binding protein [Pleurocapsales cyanobacterium LEGE 10410]|nr:ABC transporter ATP-binding protein [Pleurocapsales cyanobacterium LEGE 10410]
MKQSAILQLRNVTKAYPNRASFNSRPTVVLDNVSLTLQHGELLGLLGPSGCGKTTLLRIVAGFESISQGTVEIAGKVVCNKNSSVAAEKRNTGMVFQDYALFPHLTVAENIAFGLKNRDRQQNKSLFTNKKSFDRQVKQRVTEVLKLVGLEGLDKRYPHQLSGGQQQRISLARALAPQPNLILLDEPLSNLDVQVRHRLRAEIRSILKAAGTSAIFVTHDREEALAISDKIAVMCQGKVEQVGTPEEVYLNPRSHFVAEFVTQANFLPAKRKGRVWLTEIGEIAVSKKDFINDRGVRETSDEGDLMLRPEDITLTPDVTATTVIVEKQFLGREYFYCVATASGKRLYVRTNLNKAIAVGTKVNLSPNISSPQIFPLASKINKPLVSVS